jgi:hypothetical protein
LAALALPCTATDVILPSTPLVAFFERRLAALLGEEGLECEACDGDAAAALRAECLTAAPHVTGLRFRSLPPAAAVSLLAETLGRHGHAALTARVVLTRSAQLARRAQRGAAAHSGGQGGW